jgi:hypothetical protein
MHWEILIIPLIALGVWILGALVKGEDEKTKKPVRRPGNASGRAPRRPMTDLQRFLEATRRREAEETPQPLPPRPSIARAPLRERPSQPRETPPRPAPRSKRRDEAPVAAPIARPVVAEAVVAAPVRAEPSAPAPTTTRPTPASPIAQQVFSLLSNPQTAATAFVLREIFDRPLSQRRR